MLQFKLFVKPFLSGHSKGRPKLVFKIGTRLMQVQSIVECSNRAYILSTFIELPFVFKTFVLSIFEWPLKTGFDRSKAVLLWIFYGFFCLVFAMH